MKALGDLLDFHLLLLLGQSEAVRTGGVGAEHGRNEIFAFILSLHFLDLDLTDEGQNASDVLLDAGETVGGSRSTAALSLLDAEAEILLPKARELVLKRSHVELSEVFTAKLFRCCVSSFLKPEIDILIAHERVWGGALFVSRTQMAAHHIAHGGIGKRGDFASPAPARRAAASDRVFEAERQNSVCFGRGAFRVCDSNRNLG